ncbi:MAG: ECF-type sigma factor, partial [Bacteroidota bacterium]
MDTLTLAPTLDVLAAMPTPADVTVLLHQARAGDEAAMDRLVPLIYDELRAMAHQRLRYERADHTLNTTGLVHEAYLKLSKSASIDWQDRAHFFALASRSMRRILIDYSIQRKAVKRGGGQAMLSLDDTAQALEAISDGTLEHVLALDEALTRLAQFNPRGAQIVEYRYFVGLTQDEIAEVMGISIST